MIGLCTESAYFAKIKKQCDIYIILFGKWSNHVFQLFKNKELCGLAKEKWFDVH